MEDNLILEGLLSMVTELKEKLEAQVTPASREETLERFGAIEQALSRLHSNPAVPVEKLQTIQSQLDDVRNRMQGQQQHIEIYHRFDTPTSPFCRHATTICAGGRENPRTVGCAKS